MRIGGVSYFTPEERAQLKRDDRLMNHSGKSTSLEAKQKKLENSYGQRLAKAREKKNMTQKQLAELLGVDRSTVFRWESTDGLFPWEKVQAVLPEIGPRPKDYPRK